MTFSSKNHNSTDSMMMPGAPSRVRKITGLMQMYAIIMTTVKRIRDDPSERVVIRIIDGVAARAVNAASASGSSRNTRETNVLSRRISWASFNSTNHSRRKSYRSITCRIKRKASEPNIR